MSDAPRLGAPELDALVERVRQEADDAARKAWERDPDVTADWKAWKVEREVWSRRLRELGEALLPFAKASAEIEPTTADDEPVIKDDQLMVGDLRRAAHLLRENEQET